ncbi:MAG TPA: GNAT family N-acetyltransferase [Acidimicrobiales bacterium]|nr:GNAT family N-acetyltransferase [Acidimicrobiales bacterium]
MVVPAPTPSVTDVPGENRLVVDHQGARAELVYQVDDGRLVLVHTGVPKDLSGRGVGGELVRAAVARAAHDHLTVVPRCPFARRWLKSHPEVVAEAGAEVDWSSRPPA